MDRATNVFRSCVFAGLQALSYMQMRSTAVGNVIPCMHSSPRIVKRAAQAHRPNTHSSHGSFVGRSRHFAAKVFCCWSTSRLFVSLDECLICPPPCSRALSVLLAVDFFSGHARHATRSHRAPRHRSGPSAIAARPESCATAAGVLSATCVDVYLKTTASRDMQNAQFERWATPRWWRLQQRN